MIDRTFSRLAPCLPALGALVLLVACGCAERREPFEIELPEASPVDPEDPDSASPDSASPDSASPDSASPDSASPDSASPDSASPDSASPDSASPDSASPDSAYIGLTLEEARELAEDRDLDHRVTRVDGESRPVTTDFRLDRINFHVEENRIIAVSRG